MKTNDVGIFFKITLPTRVSL